jgi:hypothetical protein
VPKICVSGNSLTLPNLTIMPVGRRRFRCGRFDIIERSHTPEFRHPRFVRMIHELVEAALATCLGKPAYFCIGMQISESGDESGGLQSQRNHSVGSLV